MYCPAGPNEKCVYISTNTTSKFSDCKSAKPALTYMAIHSRNKSRQKLFFSGYGTQYVAERRIVTLKKNTSPFLKKNPPITTKYTRAFTENHSVCGLIVSTRH